MKFASILPVAALLVFAGCSRAPSPAEIDAADYGQYPTNYQEVVKSYMGERLKDPYSAQYDFFKGPTRLWTGGGLSSKKYGYGVCARINAKNSFGGYTGSKLYFFLINNGLVIRSYGEEEGIVGEAGAEKMCNGAW